MSLCRAPGCTESCRPRSHYCRHHARRLNKYACPFGRPLPLSWLTDYAVSARLVIAANPNHDGVKAASAELLRLFRESAQAVSAGTGDPLHRHFARLAAHGAMPVDILAMYAAVALYDRAHEKALRTPEEFRYAVARAICGLVPRQEMPLGARALDRIGRYIVERYAGIASGIVIACEHADTSARQRAAVMSAPFANH